MAASANIVTREPDSTCNSNAAKLQVALTVVIRAQDNRRQNRRLNAGSGGPLCRQTPSLLPMISLSPSCPEKTKRYFCVSSRVNVGTFLSPLQHTSPKIFKGSYSQTTTSPTEQVSASPKVHARFLQRCG
jgi:hypothetical protein